MEVEAARYIGAGLAVVALGGAGAGLGVLFGNYLNAAVRNPALVRLRDRVSVVADDTMGAGETLVRVTGADGKHERKVDIDRPEPDLDVLWGKLRAKFDGLAAPVVGAGAAGRAADAVRAIESEAGLGRIIEAVVARPAQVAR